MSKTIKSITWPDGARIFIDDQQASAEIVTGSFTFPAQRGRFEWLGSFEGLEAAAGRFPGHYGWISFNNANLGERWLPYPATVQKGK